MSYMEIKTTVYNEIGVLERTVIVQFTVIDYILCECGKSFQTEDLLKEHLDNTEDAVCAEKLVKEYQCMLCTKTFTSNKSCKLHVKLMHCHDGPKKKKNKNKSTNVCDLCNKTFSCRFFLTNHYRTHTGEKPYSCEECPKHFSTEDLLRQHMRVHTGEKPYQCTVCHKKFSIKGNLNRHHLVHTGERPHSCTICGKSYQQIIGLKQHIQTIHQKIPLKPRVRHRRTKYVM